VKPAYRILIGLMILLFFFINKDAACEELRDFLTSIKNNEYKLRRLINHSTVLYPDPPYNFTDAFAVYEDTRSFLYKKDRIVKIVDTKMRNYGKIVITYENEATDRQKIRFISPRTRFTYDIFKNVFDRIFGDMNEVGKYEYYVLDIENMTYHVRGSNHVKDISYLLSDFENENPHKCLACFGIIVLITL